MDKRGEWTRGESGQDGRDSIEWRNERGGEVRKRRGDEMYNV